MNDDRVKNINIASPKTLEAYMQENPKVRSLLRSYLRRLWVKYSSLKLHVLTGPPMSSDTISLPGVYTALNTGTYVAVNTEDLTISSPEQFVPSTSSHLYQRICDETRLLSRSGRPYIRPITAVEMLEYYPKLVLLGSPGSGKSTFAHFVTLCMAGEILEEEEANLRVLNVDVQDRISEPWLHGTVLPVCIELRVFARSNQFPVRGVEGTSSHLLNFVNQTLPPGHAPDIQDYLQKGNSALLILDGLDEITQVDQSRERIREIISDFVKAYPHCRVLVTCRPYAYRDPDWRLDHLGFNEATLADMNEIQVDSFIRHRYKYLEERGLVDPDLANKRASVLITNIQQRPYLKQLAASPLLLTMLIATTERSGGILPINRSVLYDEYVELLLDRWNQQRGLSISVVSADLGITPSALRDILERLAFEIHREQGSLNDTAHIDYKQLYTALDTFSSESRTSIEQVMDYLHQRSGILVAESPFVYHFPHRSIQEFLAACHLVKREDYPDLLAKLAIRNPELWREVLLFAAWKATSFRDRDVWELAAELCSETVPQGEPSGDQWWGALLSGLVLVETNMHKRAASSRHKTLLPRVRSWLMTCVNREKMLPSERAEVGRILSTLGDLRSGISVRDDGVPDIEWVEIPAGPFIRGSSETDAAAYANEMPQEIITLPTFYISKYPLTVAQFRAFVESDDFPKNDYDITHRKTWNDPEWHIDNHPVAEVTLGEAMAFCEWLSKKLGIEVRLPTEVEWEKAARGTDGRVYPWGEGFDNDKCNVTGVGRITAVGLFPSGASPFGVMDMAGNVWEWCNSFWSDGYDTTVVNTHHYVIRGGSFNVKSELVRCAARGKEGTSLLLAQGFRVVTSRKIEP